MSCPDCDHRACVEKWELMALRICGHNPNCSKFNVRALAVCAHVKIEALEKKIKELEEEKTRIREAHIDACRYGG